MGSKVGLGDTDGWGKRTALPVSLLLKGFCGWGMESLNHRESGSFFLPRRGFRWTGTPLFLSAPAGHWSWGRGALPWPVLLAAGQELSLGTWAAGRGGGGRVSSRVQVSLAETLMRELPVSVLCLVSSKAQNGPRLPQSSFYSHRHTPWRANDGGGGRAIDQKLSRCSQCSACPQEGRTDPPEAPSGVPEYAVLFASLFLFPLPHTQLACP